MSDIQSYYDNLQSKINTKELNDFWLICGKSTFTPIKNTTKTIIKKYLKSKAQYYQNKCIANVKLILRPKINFNNINDDDWIFTVKIYLYHIDENGNIGNNESDTWSLVVLYNSNELLNNKFKLAELLKMIDLAYNKKTISDIFGMSYSFWRKKSNKF